MAAQALNIICMKQEKKFLQKKCSPKACSYPARLNTAKLIVICCFRILDFMTSRLLPTYTATLSRCSHKFGIPKLAKLARIVFKSHN